MHTGWGGELMLCWTLGTYEGLNPVGHTKDVGMPVIVRGPRSSRHFNNAVWVAVQASYEKRRGLWNFRSWYSKLCWPRSKNMYASKARNRRVRWMPVGRDRDKD
jgi:hypothetical protein